MSAGRHGMGSAVVGVLVVALSMTGVGAVAAKSSSPVSQPDGTTTVIVTMLDQARLSATATRGRVDAERTVRTLKATARQSQDQIRDLLSRWEAAGSVSEVTPLWITNALSVTATSKVISMLAARSDVLSITPDAMTLTPTSTAVEPNIAVVGADAVWGQGARGAGVVVASLDSGVDVSHPDLGARWRGGSNSWFDPYDEHPTIPTDLTGHGTATVGVMVGGSAGGTAIGVAPGAEWIAAKIFNDRGTTTATAVHQAFQWALDPDDDPTTDDAPDVVNGSWSLGSGPGCDLSLQPDLQALRAAGIVPVFAAGNFGPGGTSSVSPANYPEALSVGAVTNSDLIYSASSRGPSTCGGRTRVFPDVVAPGVNVTTTDRYGLYQTVSGTSVAAPHVSAALALLLGESRGLPRGAQEDALISETVDLGLVGPDSTFGAGRIDVPAALAAQSSMPGFSVATSTPAVTVNAGSNSDIEVTVAARNGFSAPVTMSVSALPAAVGTAVITPGSVAGSGTSTLHLDLALSAPAGTYPITVTGVSGTAVDRALLSVTVPPQDFTLRATPSTRSVLRGDATSFRVCLLPEGGFAGAARLSRQGLPSATTAQWTRKKVSGKRCSRLKVVTTAGTPKGTHRLVIRGRAGNLDRRTSVTLVVG